jgi:hypothetical protein
MSGPTARTWIIVGLVTTGLLMFAMLAAAGVWYYFAVIQQGDQAPVPAPVEIEPAIPQEPAEEPIEPVIPTEPMPEDTIVDFYDAAKADDLEMLRKTLIPSFGLDESILVDWGDPDYTIDVVTSAGTEGELKIEVSEEGGGLTGDVVTFTVVLQPDGEWLISDWFEGGYMDDPDFGAGATIIPPTETQEAANVVGSLLGFRMMGDIATMKEYATDRMIREQPGVFTFEWNEFTGYETYEGRREGDAIVVEALETWSGGTVTREYVVVIQDGEMLVDEQR